MCSIGPKDLVFDKNGGSGIYGGGFSVNSIMMQGGISPIMTLNNIKTGGQGLGQVSDIFSGLAVPAYVYHNGGSTVKSNSYKSNNEDDESDDDVIDEDLHEKLLGLVKEHESILNQNERKKRRTRKHNGKPKKANTRKSNRKLLLSEE